MNYIGATFCHIFFTEAAKKIIQNTSDSPSILTIYYTSYTLYNYHDIIGILCSLVLLYGQWCYDTLHYYILRGYYIFLERPSN